MKIELPDIGFLSVSVDPLRDRLASSSPDRIIRIWNTKNGNLIRTIHGHSGNISSIEFCPNGKAIVSASEDTTIRIWDVKTGTEIKRLEGHSAKCNSASFSHNGEKIVSTSIDNTIRVWDVASGNEIRIIDDITDSVHAAIFSPDDHYVISTVGKEIKIWGAFSLDELISMTRERFKNRQLTHEERKKYYLD